jgi:hypothetical protein
MTVMRDTVVNSIAKLRIQSDENGLVPEYEVLVNLLPVSLLNTFSEKILKAAPPEKKEQVEQVLCGQLMMWHHTGCGVIPRCANEVVIQWLRWRSRYSWGIHGCSMGMGKGRNCSVGR